MKFRVNFLNEGQFLIDLVKKSTLVQEYLPISVIQKFENDTGFPVENPIFGHFPENPEIFYMMIGFSPTNVWRLFLRFEELVSALKEEEKKSLSPLDYLVLLSHYFWRYPRIEEMSVVLNLTV